MSSMHKLAMLTTTVQPPHGIRSNFNSVSTGELNISCQNLRAIEAILVEVQYVTANPKATVRRYIGRHPIKTSVIFDRALLDNQKAVQTPKQMGDMYDGLL